MGVYIVEADLQAAMSTDDYSRLFDRNGTANSAEITAFATLAIAYGESRINSVLNGRVPIPLPAPIDAFVKQCNLDLACAFAARYHPSYQGDERSPYAIQGKEGLQTIKDLARDFDARTVTSPAGIAKPVAALVNATDDNSTPNDPYTRQANAEDVTGF